MSKEARPTGSIRINEERKQTHPTHLGETRKVDKSERHNLWRIDLEEDGELGDPFVLPCYAHRFLLNLAADLMEVLKAPIEVQELGILGRLAAIWTCWRVHQLQDERSPRHNAATAGEKVFADNTGGDQRELQQSRESKRILIRFFPPVYETHVSRTLLFPEDCEPTTTHCGRSTESPPMAANVSCSLLTALMRSVSMARGDV